MRNRVLCLSIAMSLASLSSPLLAQDHAHHAPADSSAAADAARFATDAPLRKGMQDIRQAVDRLGHYERGHLSAQDAVAAAGQVETGVRYIIANCKLPPDADAALHAIIVPLLQNATALKADPARRDAIPAMRQALQQYERRFDDPGAAQPDEPEEG